MIQVKLAVPSDSEPLWWEKIEKVVNWAKLATLSDSDLLRCKKIGKVANWPKLAIPSDSELFQWKRLEKLQIGRNCPFQMRKIKNFYQP